MKKSFVVMNGVNLDRFDPENTEIHKIRDEFGIDGDFLIIGMTSRFGPDKGHEEFIKAAKVLLSKRGVERGRLKFLIVGSSVFEVDREREEYLKGMVREYGLWEDFIFTGFRDDVPNLLALMDIFVLPAHQEPCGRVLFEAQAMEVPVIGTSSGGTPEIVEDGVTGLLFKPKNVDELVEKLELLIGNPLLRKRMGKAGRQRMKYMFPIKNNSELTMKIYRRLLGEC
jgi:glycosyltransferase involved in cell wall biosynthesis